MGFHADAAFGALQDDGIYQWISMDKPTDLEALRAKWTRAESRMSPDETEAWPIWVITARSDGALVGQVDATIDEHGVCTNLGYHVYPAFWCQGLASEAIRIVADYLVQLGIRPLLATVTVGNHASAQVLKKAGFVFHRIIANNDTLNGIPVDDEEYIRTA